MEDLDNPAMAVALAKALGQNAREQDPQDPLSKGAYILQTILLVPLIPLTIVSIPVKNILGCLVAITFGILLLPLSLLWLPFFGYALGTSWLWIKVPLLRPILIIPSVLVNLVGYTYVAFIPDMGEPFQKQVKLLLCDSWPYSWHVYQLSKQIYTNGVAEPND